MTPIFFKKPNMRLRFVFDPVLRRMGSGLQGTAKEKKVICLNGSTKY
jgi:hypothetical protein